MQGLFILIGEAVFLTMGIIRCRDRRLDGPLEINITAMIIGEAVLSDDKGRRCI